jgi:fatty acid desaturase
LEISSIDTGPRPPALDGTPLREAPSDFDAVRREIARQFGVSAIARWHRQSALLDGLVIVGLPSLFVGLALALSRVEFGVLWVVCFLLQGCLFQTLAHAVHDLFVHRRVGGLRASHVLGGLFHLPIFYRRTWYALYHLDHHRHLGTELDTEAYKQDLDTRWKRVLCLTLIGFTLARARRLRPVNAASPRIGKAPLVTPTDPAILRRLRAERVAVMATAVALVPAALLWPRVLFFGYLLPLVLVAPAASLLRLILEHGETNPENPHHCATFYRTGIITRPLFFWDAGDCHIVHHIFPGIPFYRMGEAVDALATFLRRQGARERRSFLWLLHGYFVRNEPHRALWQR